MSKLPDMAYGRWEGGGVVVTGLTGNRFDWLVISRKDYFLSNYSLPVMQEKELAELLEYKVKAVYPGNPDDVVYDYVYRKTGRDSEILLVIMKKEILEGYRRAAEGARLIILPQLVKTTEGRIGHSMETEFFGEYCIHSGTEFISSGYGPCPAFEEIQLIHWPWPIDRIRSAGLFNEKLKGMKRISPFWIIPAIIFFLSSVLGVQFLFMHRDNTLLELRKQEYLNHMQNKKKIIVLRQEISVLEQETDKIVRSERGNIYGKLSRLFGNIPEDTRVTYLLVNENHFQIRMISRDPVSIMQAFGETPGLINIDSSAVNPVEKSGEFIFTVTGDLDG